MINKASWKRGLRVVLFGAIVLVPIISRAAEPEAVPEEQLSPQKIRQAGQKKDRSKIRQLREIKARREKTRHSEAYNAQVSLAQMGEKQEMDEIVTESKSDDPAAQAEAIKKLEYVGNKQAIRALIGLLDDMRIRRGRPVKGPDGKVHESDEGFGPPSFSAIRALKKLVPDGPGFRGRFPTKADAEAWKDWWKINKSKYE